MSSAVTDGIRTGEGAVEAVIDLDDPRASDPEVVGRKAATLARLRAEGYPVPDGVVVTTAACAELRDGSGGAVEPGEGLRVRLGDVLAEIGGGPVAVRSSGVAEDLPDASYAGQYDSVLGVDSTDDLCAAVRTCVASGTADRVLAYARDAGTGPEAPAVAVLVQRQVAADAAGAAFSANPVTGDRDETLVSAVRGLGERLMSGEATPDEWIVRGGDVEVVASREESLTEDQVRTVASLAERLESALGEPQDIEWAVVDGEIRLLQARPITALPREPELDAPTEGTWTKDVSHYSELVTPLGASIYLPLLDAGLNRMFEEYGMLLERIENRCIGGEIYGHAVPVGGKEGPPPPWWVMALLSRIVPPLRARMRTAAKAVERGRLDEVPRRWEEQWRDEFRQAAAALREVELGDLDDTALEAHLDEAITLLERGERIHFELFPPHVVGVHELVRACEELLGWEAIEAMDLLAGLSEASSEPATELAALAAEIRAHPDLDALDLDPAELVEALEDRAPQLASSFHDYLQRYGHRAVNYDPGSPTLVERPHLVASLLRDAVRAEAQEEATTPAERRQSAERRAEEILAGRSREDRERFDEALAFARRVYPQREDNIFWTDNLPCGLIRRAALEMGRRLSDRGQLRTAHDVAYLEVDEVRACLQDRSRDLTDTARRRRAERAWVAAHPGPPFHGDEPSEFPDVRGLPEAGRRINESFLWFMGHEYQATALETDEGLGGVPGSPGRYTGPVRVITSDSEFHRLRPGDVLVAPITTPVWSVLFSQAGAVVTDGGGTLSHAAIVAREHGIPAVLATGDATERLSDGQVVTVDGAAGIVSEAEDATETGAASR